MNQKSLTKLEFPKIIEMLTDHASSPGGASFCRQIKPMTDLNKIITAQEQTAAAFTRIVKKGIPSFNGCYAVSDSLKRLEIGSALSAPELLRIGKLLQSGSRSSLPFLFIPKSYFRQSVPCLSITSSKLYFPICILLCILSPSLIPHFLLYVNVFLLIKYAVHHCSQNAL